MRYKDLKRTLVVAALTATMVLSPIAAAAETTDGVVVETTDSAPAESSDNASGGGNENGGDAPAVDSGASDSSNQSVSQPAPSATVEVQPGTAVQNTTSDGSAVAGETSAAGVQTGVVGSVEGAEIVVVPQGTDTTTADGTPVVSPDAATIAPDGSIVQGDVQVDPTTLGIPSGELNTLVGDATVDPTMTTMAAPAENGAAMNTAPEGGDAAVNLAAVGDETNIATQDLPEGSAVSDAGTAGQETPSTEEPANPRPTQSQTVETLPGTKEQNFPTSTEESSGETGKTEEGTGETGEGSGTGKEEGSESGETGEGEASGEEAEDEQDFTWAYNEETGHFQVTFNIKEDAKGDQTIELSKVMEEVNAYGKQQIEEFLESEEGQKKLDNEWYYAKKITFTVDDSGLKFVYNLRTGETTYYEEPGCTMVFDVSLSNGSKHTYTYKDDSFIVSTPDVSNNDNTGVIAFDGQELPSEYSNSSMSFQYSKDASVTGCIESIVDEALKNSKSNWSYYVDANGNKTTSHKKVTIPAGTPVYEVNGRYYAKTADGYYYGAWTESQTKEVNGVLVLKNNSKSGFEMKELKDNGSLTAVKVPYQRGSAVSTLRPSDYAVESYVQAYLKSKLDDTTTSTGVALANEIVSYYNTKDGTSYKTLGELLEQNETAAKELDQVTSPGNLGVTATVASSKRYDKFYNSILSFNVGSEEDMEKFLAGENESTAHGHEHGNWVSKGDASRTIGQYMADKLSETDGAWDKANTYFNQLLAAGVSSDQATWVAFTMATNIDGENADNEYQNSIWSWYSSIVLEQLDGTFELIKTDQNNNVIGDDEGEDQTSFWIWKYEEETDENGETTKVPMYCTYVNPVYETVKDEDGNIVTDEEGNEVQRLVSDGYFTWVKYDPEKKALDFTVTTTNGTLKIDYAMLANVVYYLQEAVAPKGYEIDKTIYIICDAETYEEMKNEDGVVIATNPATGVESIAKYMGAIEGGKTLTVRFVNPSTPVPTPTPDPTPDPGPGHDDSHETTPQTTPEPLTIEEAGSTSTPTPEPIAIVEYGSIGSDIVESGSFVIQTGDASQMTLYGSIALICLVVLAGYLVAMRRKNHQ